MKKIIALALTSFLLSPCFGILEIKKISLEEALSLAINTNPQIKIAKLNVESAKNEIKIANQLKNPNLNTFNLIGDLRKEDSQNIGASWEIEILKRKKRKESAKINSSIIENNKNFQEQELIFAIKKAYINLLHKKSNLKILKEQQELAKELYDETVKNRKKTKTDEVEAKIALNQAIMHVNIARSEVISAQNQFNTTMNTNSIDYDTKEDYLNGDWESLLTKNPKDDDLIYEEIKKYALENRFDLKSAEKEVEKAKADLKVIKSQLIPNIEIGGGYGFQTADKLISSGYVAGSITNIPLFYQYKSEIKNAQIEIEQAKLKYQDLEIDIIRNITDAWEKYSISRDVLNFYNEELLANSKELAEASIKSYNKKEIDLTTFLVSKKVYLELMLGYHQALKDYYVNYAELIKEMNLIDYSVEAI